MKTKNMLLFIGLCFSLSSLQNARADMFDQVPEEYCSPEYYDCSAFSLKILGNYNSGHTPLLNAEEALYSGSCYMVSSTYNKDHEHFAYLYFRKNNEKIDFFGAFSFFYEENPYKKMSLEEARLLNSEPSKYQVTSSATEWRVDTNIDPPWQYFIRETELKLYVIGFWGYNDSLTCEFEKN